MSCGTALALVCPGCGQQHPPLARFCMQCGTPLQQPSGPPPAPEPPAQTAPRPPTGPDVEGERKQITVLFADVVGSTELIRGRDTEEAQEILDGVVRRMMEAVHRYEGTVSRLMGDGLMAMFGAPVALEDHALRACHAALAMQETVRRHAREIERQVGGLLEIRVGLNSGEVVVRAIRDDIHSDYTAMGETVHLAARMEQLAAPGTIVLAPDTAALVEGLVQTRPLGAVPVKGLAEAVDVHALVGLGPVRSRLEASATRGLTRFVGREAEYSTILDALAQAANGHGQVVALVGEPGVGKSRLIHEILRAPRLQGWRLIRGAALPYGRATPLLPIVELVRSCLEIGPADDAGAIRATVERQVSRLGEPFDGLLTPLLAMLNLPVEDETWQFVPPAERRRLTIDAVRQLLLRAGAERPALLLCEDLHWLDAESQAVLDAIVEGLPATRTLLLVTYRPEYAHGWGGTSWYRQLRIETLQPTSAHQLLDALLGQHPSLASLERLLIERTTGNPFFLEESVRALVETGVLVGGPGAYERADPHASITIPATVRATLASRIDRLRPDDKALLQVAAVIGKDVPLALLQAAAGRPDGELFGTLIRLQASELLDRASVAPEMSYSFCHALTRDVAYESLLAARRRTLHAGIASAMEQLYQQRLDEHAAAISHHFEQAREHQRAIPYLELAADRARARYANAEAVALYQAAIGYLEDGQPTGDADAGEQLDRAQSLHERLGDVLELMSQHEAARAAYLRAASLSADPVPSALLQRKIGATWTSEHRYAEALEAYERAETLLGAEPALDDDRPWWQAWLQIAFDRMGIHYWLAQVDDIARLAAQAGPVVERHATPIQRGDFYQRLVLFGLRRDRYRPSDQVLAHARLALDAAREASRASTVGVARFLVGFCHLWRGETDEAEEQIGAALAIADQTGDVTHQSRCLTYLTICARMRGRVDEARDLAARSLAAAAAGQMLEYVGTAHANMAWVAWRERRLADAETEGEAALESWQQLPSTHASCAFQWTALWPLSAVAVAEGRREQAADLFGRLLLPEQHPPPDPLAALVTRAVDAAQNGAPADFADLCRQAITLAQDLGYL